jgi:hypothetical protein
VRDSVKNDINSNGLVLLDLKTIDFGRA